MEVGDWISITLTLIECSLVCQAPGQVLKVNYCLIQPFL